MVTWGMIFIPDGEPVPSWRKPRFARVVRIPGLGFRRSRGNDLLAKDPGAGSRPACVFAGDARRGRLGGFDSAQPENCKGRQVAGQAFGAVLADIVPMLDSKLYLLYLERMNYHVHDEVAMPALLRS